MDYSQPICSFAIWPNDPREMSYARFWNHSLDALLHIHSSRLPNGHYLASLEEMQDIVATGISVKDSMDQLMARIFQRFSDPSLAKQLSTMVSSIDRNPRQGWKDIKRVYLKMEFGQPYFPKQDYNPPPNTPCVRIPISDQDLMKMGRLIGYQGHHFIQWTQKYGLDYIWFHKDKKEIEIYGRYIPQGVIDEIWMTLRSL